MGVDELLEGTSMRTPHVDMDRARTAIDARSRQRSRRRAAIVGSGAALVLVVVAVVAIDRPDDDGTVAVLTDVTSSDETPPVDESRPTGSEHDPGWELMSEAPISSRVGHVAVSTGEAMVVWGGSSYGQAGREVFADGASYSYETGEWTRVPPAPLGGRSGAVAVWTGDEVIVVGGFDAQREPLTEPVAWNPGSNTWRIVPAPELVWTGAIGAAWVGDTLVVVGMAPAGETTDGSEVVALDVDSGAVRELGRVPGAIEARARAVEWTGNHVLVVSGVDGQPVTIDALDPVGGSWDPTVTTQAPGLDFDSDRVVWTGTDLIIVNNRSEGVRFRPGDRIAPIPAAPGAVTYPAAAVTESIVSVGDLWLDLEVGTWHDAGEVPEPWREFPTAVAEGGRYYLWGGDACGPAASCVVMVDPGPGLVWTPPESGEAKDELDGESSDASQSTTTEIGDARITISVEPSELTSLAVEVGPAVERENGWFEHALRVTNTSDRQVRIDDNKESRFLGQPSALLVAEPGCGYSGRSDDPDAPVGAGTCLGVLLEYDAAPGETVVQDWWAARDLPGLVPGGFGTFRYAKTIEYSVGGGDSPVEQHSEVVTITYENVEIGP